MQDVRSAAGLQSFPLSGTAGDADLLEQQQRFHSEAWQVLQKELDVVWGLLQEQMVCVTDARRFARLHSPSWPGKDRRSQSTRGSKRVSSRSPKRHSRGLGDLACKTTFAELTAFEPPSENVSAAAFQLEVPKLPAFSSAESPAAHSSASPRVEEAASGSSNGQPKKASPANSSRKTISLPKIELHHYSNHDPNRAARDNSFTLPPINDGFLLWFRACAVALLNSRYFEPAMGAVIALNALNIGWIINLELHRQDIRAHEAIEMGFLGIFVMELVLRVYVRGFRSLRLPFNFFDFVLVLVTVVTDFTKRLLDLSGSSLVETLEQVMILRTMRLLRLARAVRLIAVFGSLWKLVQGLMHCIGTMVSALLLMFVTIYIFACFGAEFITKVYENDPKIGHLIQSQFDTLPKILLTLFQFVSMDSTAAFYVPIVLRSPVLSIYFLLLLVTVAIAMMNLITAFLVEDAISTAQMDDEMKAVFTKKKLKRLKPALRDLFRTIDSSGDGLVEIREILEVIEDGLTIPEPLQGFLNPARMVDLFEALDADDSGELTEDEFVDGLIHVALTDVPLETMQILHLLRCLRRETNRSMGHLSPPWYSAAETPPDTEEPESFRGEPAFRKKEWIQSF